MFGYVLPHKPELKIREYDAYRAYYCAICKAIGKRCGQISRLALNYDFTFLSVVLSSLSSEELSIKRERCIAHPFKKRTVIKTDKSIIEYAADMNILLAYYNLEDKARDDRSLFPVAAMLALKRAVRKIKKRYPEKCAIIEGKLLEQKKLEYGKCASMDLAAEPFAGLMEEILCYNDSSIDEKDQKILRWIGYNLGKWIYLIDACDDFEKDVRRGQYNPLALQFEYTEGDAGEFKKSFRERVEFNLTQTLRQISTSMELLAAKKNKGILDNIAYMGLLAKTDNILNKTGSCKKVEKSV